MNSTSLTWRGLTIATGDVPYRLRELEGWEELPAGRYEKTNRTRGHGSHRSKVWADERIVTVTGSCWTAVERDALLAQMQEHLAFDGDGDDGDTEPLQVTVAGRTLTAGAQLLAARQALVRGEWGVGRFGFVVQWRCPNPIRYGPAATVTTPLPEAGGGLVYPLTYALDYGSAGQPGQVTVDNPGTAPAPLLLAVTGAHDFGFEVAAAGRRLRYEAPVPAGQTVTIDTATGTVLVEDSADRRYNLTQADWITVPRGQSLTLSYVTLGGVRDPAALLAATVAGAYW